MEKNKLYEEFFYNELKILLDREFPILNTTERDLLFDYLKDIIFFIIIRFSILTSNIPIFFNQLRLNNYRDVIGILNLLLPYIDDPHGDAKKQIKNLNDIYVSKKSNGEYKFSNIQFGRINRNTKEEIRFNRKHLEDSYKLLKLTINSVSHKLFVNWINIIPYSIDTYKNTSLYTFTKYFIDNNKISDFNPNVKEYIYGGLSIETIYDTISNDLYENIKDIKWLIFEINIEKENKIRQVPFIVILNSIFKLDNLEQSYDELEIDKQRELNELWMDLIKRSKTSLGIPSLKLKNSDLVRVLKSIIIFFNRFYKNINQIEDYIDLDDDDDDNNDDELEEESIGKFDINSGALAKTLESLPTFEHIYNFIRDSVDEFKSTWYYHKLVKNEKIPNLNEFNPQIINNKIITVTLKNIYNYSKSIVNDIIDNGSTTFLERQPKFYRSLNKIDREFIIEKITIGNTKTKEVDDNFLGNKAMSFFNISRYARNLGYVTKPELTDYHGKLIRVIKDNIVDIVCESLIYRGVLNEFIPNSDILRPEKNKSIKQKLNEKYFKNPQIIQSQFANSYYFLSGKKYIDTITDGQSYFDIMKNDRQSWFTTYAMDWISQIGFFHHYYNNRMIMVTGSTGVGKSTQIPKLLLYGLKMVDYKNIGKVIVTMPRKPPTENGAIRVSSELGLPIRNTNDEPTNNYSVQFKHQSKNHISKTDKLSVKFVTDGTLLQELKNPLLKRLRRGKFSNKNIYDVVVVDEAHEHNTNMDLILTLMRYTSYYNNDIKLVIVSATMEEDEPTYRRYYRDIDDNRMFPLNHLIKEENLNRINIDRRLHISPPGQSTRFRIDEKYVHDAKVIDIIKEIINTTYEGDILLFEPGQREIKERVEEINRIIPRSDVIALPYYGSMIDEKRNFIESLSKESKFDLRLNKRIPYDAADGEDEKFVPSGTYKRVIIVGTNVAEASLTLGTLKFVVETGSQKVSKYDYRSGSSKIELQSISESSRMQRRGRVGRVSDGMVYYMYKEGDMAKNKTAYNISLDNITDVLFSLFKNELDEEELITTDPNNPKNKIRKGNLRKLFKNGIDRMIRDQYFINDEYYDYFGNEQINSPPDYYKTGYDYKTLTDENGEFYIIHPNELCFDRNIFGEIINKEECKSDKMISFWKNMQDSLLVIRTLDNNMMKTKYGIKLSILLGSIMKNFTLSINLATSIIFSKINGIYDMMLLFIAGITTNVNINTYASTYLTSKGQFRTKLDKLQEVYNTTSDFMTIVKIGELLLRYLKIKTKNKLGIEVVDEHSKDISKYAQQNYLNDINSISLLKNYIILKNAIENEDYSWFESNLSQFKIRINNKELLLSCCILQGDAKNLVKHLTGNYYLQVRNPSLDNIVSIQKINPNVNILSTTVKKDYIGQYLVFFSRVDIETISLVGYIEPELIQLSSFGLYNPSLFNSSVYNSNLGELLVIDILKKIKLNELSDNEFVSRITSKYKQTLINIKNSMTNAFNPSIWEKIGKIEGSKIFKKTVKDRMNE
ncbi:MAG: hypothetical protein CMF62_02670 [Magnetococcales bacterium]|nr:hypothetical protein [Magnetococcales bacterium]